MKGLYSSCCSVNSTTWNATVDFWYLARTGSQAQAPQLGSEETLTKVASEAVI